MKKRMLVILAMVIVLMTGSTVVANGSFTSTTVNLGKGANGKNHVKISWSAPPGVSVSHYKVVRHELFYAWFSKEVCNNVTTTTCTDDTILQKGNYEYFVIAHLTNGTQIKAPASRVRVSDYVGVPAVPAVTISPQGNGSYKIGFSITSGNNADTWKLYQNGTCINCFMFQGYLTENGQNSQSAAEGPYTFNPGTYVFQVRLENAYGVTLSSPQTLVVE
ncbi:hypothetical protein [Paenibacillus arenosi]|uniref:Fibronectin type-III domain-containing protein n=1 Tax=Paenibacillus arenosi TaxID=2774142 RepID=A0ABR9B241_9BACL|nr:hypothetical protein [Paenibacillus arenosi]MBD8500447.1 hypothetical protein [Paenibacillus arenosi]